MIWSAWREVVADPEELDRVLTRTREQWAKVAEEQAEIDAINAANRWAELNEIAEVG